MWLLDANVDVHLAPLLGQFGVACDTAANRGWKALENGRLVVAAVAAGFDCMLTRVRAFAESAARALLSRPEFALAGPKALAVPADFSGGLVGIADPTGRRPAYSMALRARSRRATKTRRV